MKRQIFFGTLLSTALAVGVGAQQTPPSSSSTPGQSDRSGQTVTVTGCLQSGSGASGSTASSPTGAPAGQAGATSSSSGQYILANATMGSGSSATGTTGATPSAGAATPSAGASSSASTGKSYKLVGGDSEDLKKYVNSKVEVTGTLDSKSSSSGAGSTGTTGSAGAGASSSSMAGSMPSLKVTSVRQVSGSCTGGENR